MTGFDDLVAKAKQERESDRDRVERQRERAKKEAERAVVEVKQIGVSAANHLREARVPTIPVIEFGSGLLGRPKLVERDQAWMLPSGLLGSEGVFLDNKVVTARDAVSEDPHDVAQRRLVVLSKTGIGENDDLVLGPAKPSLHIGEYTALRLPVAYLWRHRLEYLPINDNALSMSDRYDEEKRSQKVAELIAREVASLTDDRS
ncbi:hypothetical protein ACFS27_13995 [Promicromonospora vindobonensis]|uniref:Hint domain-containing protein n=1 Tax=Promicromonospora vindobonensis TaxID=195748 RepID=A0ABW5VWC2_9MICO